MTIKMFDAAFPPQAAPDGYQVAALYVGGDTPHIATRDEWERFSHLRKLPIFTRSDPSGHSGTDDAFAALAQLYAIGAPREIAVAWDLEAAVAPAYVSDVFAVMKWAGLYLWLYGQASTVFGNPPCNGYWPAEWTGEPFILGGHDDVRATQYASGPEVDSSLVKEWDYQFRLWK